MVYRMLASTVLGSIVAQEFHPNAADAEARATAFRNEGYLASVDSGYVETDGTFRPSTT